MRKGQNWGEIDLVGVSADSLPVVVELKAAKISETAAAMLAQAAAYGVAVQNACPKRLRVEWTEVLRTRLGLEGSVPSFLSTVPLVCAAP